MTESSKEPDISPEDLRNLLKEQKISTRQLAEYLNVAETTVNRWLNEEARPTGTAKAVLWALIGAGIGAGALAPFAGIAVGAMASGIGLYKLLKEKLEKVGVDELEERVKLLKKKEETENEIKSLKQKLAEKESELREIEKWTRKEE